MRSANRLKKLSIAIKLWKRSGNGTRECSIDMAQLGNTGAAARTVRIFSWRNGNCCFTEWKRCGAQLHRKYRSNSSSFFPICNHFSLITAHCFLRLPKCCAVVFIYMRRYVAIVTCWNHAKLARNVVLQAPPPVWLHTERHDKTLYTDLLSVNPFSVTQIFRSPSAVRICVIERETSQCRRKRKSEAITNFEINPD